MENKKYNKEEIKRIFSGYRIHGDINISDEEYDLFCNAISNLPDDIADKIIKEVCFIILGTRKEDGKKTSACYLNLKSKDLENKKGIIFLSPIVFDSNDDILNPLFPILHEIAHHIEGHINIMSPEERKAAEDKADDLAFSWLGFKRK